ncbi:MarR family winged helix-turn-helix transcriptional regulator [Nocardia brasiliensis]|uniref:MarR family winged helix-turn-helix transcriptional regulator n=1 Tax=Nocardia brasiliensis TaxID=37326 RepID=UPI000B5176CE|nr:MarR family transcriptional regulator [Nocardia brasiliensis]ASF06960.1 MarR family transcriptional regulator [Nocardia brasiliensis]SUB47811.1 Multiple antibiotic resistance protein marR [Nocardia brasiliensis]
MTAQRDAGPVLGDERIGMEARAASGDHLDVRLWLRLLATTNEIEQEIRTRLRLRFATSLPRFDYLAQLDRHHDGLRMSALSRYLMVTGGNVTGLTDQLVAEGWVDRIPDPVDKRATLVRLTRLGRTRFEEMAAEHEGWLTEMFAGFGRANEQALFDLLGKLRIHLATTAELDTDPSTPRDLA